MTVFEAAVGWSSWRRKSWWNKRAENGLEKPGGGGHWWYLGGEHSAALQSIAVCALLTSQQESLPLLLVHLKSVRSRQGKDCGFILVAVFFFFNFCSIFFFSPSLTFWSAGGLDLF